MARLSILKALSTGLLSGLPDSLRLGLGVITARLISEDQVTEGFRGLQSHVAHTEQELSQALGDATNFVGLLKRDFTANISTLLFEPKPPPTEAGQPSEQEKSEKKGSWRLFSPAVDPPTPQPDSIEAFYDYFYSAYVRGSQSHISEEDLEKVVKRVIDQASEPAPPAPPPSYNSEMAQPLPDSEFGRRRSTFEHFAAVLRPIIDQFKKDRDAGQASALNVIEHLLLQHIDKIRSALAPPPRLDLPSVVVARAIDRMTASAVEAQARVELTSQNLTPEEIVSAILLDRLKVIDRVYGDPYRAALKKQERELKNWKEVRSRLTGDQRVDLVKLTEDLRRNQLRRELIAGSVQCIVGSSGEQLLRASTAEASGPPPYFMEWINDLDDTDPKRKPDFSRPYATNVVPAPANLDRSS